MPGPLCAITAALLAGVARAAVALAVVVGTASCGKPTGSEGGPCTGGGACDPGLVCLSDLCVDGDGDGDEGEGEGGEGEGEGGEGEGECQGDEPATADRADCASIPSSACAAAADNVAVQTCDVAGAILRSGIFEAAFDCLEAIPANACATLGDDVDACFAQLTACALPAADTLCANVDAQCETEGDTGFPVDACEGDLRSTNLAFRQAYADCFNAAAGTPCSDVHDDCYNTALNALVGGGA